LRALSTQNAKMLATQLEQDKARWRDEELGLNQPDDHFNV